MKTYYRNVSVAYKFIKRINEKASMWQGDLRSHTKVSELSIMLYI